MRRGHHISDILTTHTAQRPERPAVICEGRELTFAELGRESNRVANGLRAVGLANHARVAYLGRESESFYEVVFGCAGSGTVLVAVNWRLTVGEINHILRDSAAELLFTDPDLLPIIEQIRPDLPTLGTIVPMDSYPAWKAGQPDTEPDPGTDTDDPFCQIYTSGTTGLPKGVVLAHRSFFNVADLMRRGQLDWVDWRAGDTGLVGMPGFHIGGLSYAMQTLNAGSAIVAMPAFVSAEAVRLITTYKINTMIATPAMLHMILREPAATRASLGSLRTVIYGGSSISETLLNRCIDTMDCELLQIYGSTETGNFAVGLSPADHVAGGPLLGAAGRACPGVQLKIVDEDGYPVPAGAIGEVCVHSPAAMTEYWRNPDATAKTLVDGWIRMGDLGYLDEHGYLFLSGRVHDTIIVAGENIYPAETENALNEHPAVGDVAVIGVPDEQWGECVHACVVLRPGHSTTPRELMRFLKGRIADFKVPTGYTFVDMVPRNPTGKILRRELRETVRRAQTVFV